MDEVDLTEIEARRDVAYGDGSWDEPEWRDIIALLAEVERLQAQLAAVRKLHVKVSYEHPSRRYFCSRCHDHYGSQAMWPCATLRALDG